MPTGSNWRLDRHKEQLANNMQAVLTPVVGRPNTPARRVKLVFATNLYCQMLLTSKVLTDRHEQIYLWFDQAGMNKYICFN
jgi:hypothetical protein